MKLPEFDIAIVGGGLVGAAIGWGVASARPRVAILDEGDVALRASRGNFALVWVQGKGMGMPAYGLWTLRAAETWTAFADMLLVQTGIDVHYRRPGGFHLTLSQTELDKRAALLAEIGRQPGMPRIEHEVLDPAAVKRMLPEIGPEVAGATFTRMDGHCNSLRLLRALHAGFRMQGGSYLAEHRVESIQHRGGEFRLATRHGEIRAASVVLAGGLDNARLAPMVGLHMPVRAVRGQLMATEKTGRFLDYPVSTVRQSDEGSVLIGDSQEDAGLDTRVTHEVLGAMADRARRMFPRLGRLNVVRSWAALRVMPPDGCAIYDASTACRGAFAAATHSGVTLAPNHALVVAPHIARGDLPADAFNAFSARRFDVPQAA
ncbi:MAG TPA: FAD-dependent oxidoreductase [Usitatibacter sp.]|nr:FAD-dependent oxidoreductase [Usitatibacter sp.]